MSSFDDLKDRLHTSDHQLWLLIGLCVALLVTVEAVQEAVEGAWPHQRRLTRMDLSEQRAQPVWALVALLILPAALLAVFNVGMMVWKDVPRTDEMTTHILPRPGDRPRAKFRLYRVLATTRPTTSDRPMSRSAWRFRERRSVLPASRTSRTVPIM